MGVAIRGGIKTLASNLMGWVVVAIRGGMKTLASNLMGWAGLAINGGIKTFDSWGGYQRACKDIGLNCIYAPMDDYQREYEDIGPPAYICSHGVTMKPLNSFAYLLLGWGGAG